MDYIGVKLFDVRANSPSDRSKGKHSLKNRIEKNRTKFPRQMPNECNGDFNVFFLFRGQPKGIKRS